MRDENETLKSAIAPEAGTAPGSGETPGLSQADPTLRLIHNYVLASAAAGLVPAPVIDLAAVMAVQLKMLHAMSQLYGVPFSRNSAKSIVASLIGGLGATSIARGLFGSMIKMIPVLGPLAGPAVMPTLAAGATYAVGMLFMRHFESGGTVLNFNSHEARGHFARLCEEGQRVVSDLKNKPRRQRKPTGATPASPS